MEIGPTRALAWLASFVLAAVLAWGTLVSINISPQILYRHGGADIRYWRLYPAHGRPDVGDSGVYWKFRHEIEGLDTTAYEAVLVGDSSTMMSIHTMEFERASGLTAYNLGFDGSQTLDLQTDLLEVYLAEHPRPKWIVVQLATLVGFGARNWGSPAGFDLWLKKRDNVRTWLSLVSKKRRFKPPRWNISIDLVEAIDKVQKYAGTIDYDALNEPRGPFPSDNEFAKLLYANRGFYRDPRQPGGHAQSPRAMSATPINFEVATDHDSVSASNLLRVSLTDEILGGRARRARCSHPPIDSYPCPYGYEYGIPELMIPMLDRLYRISTIHDIPMLFVATPFREDYFNYYGGSDSFSRLIAHLRLIAEPYPEVHFFQPLWRFYPPDIVFDGAHFHGDGPERNAREIGTFLRDFR